MKHYLSPVVINTALFLLLVPFLTTGNSWADDDHKPRLIVLKTLDLHGIREPSGLCINPESGNLYVAGDEGTVAEVSKDGEILSIHEYPHNDFEGVAWFAEDNALFVLDEEDFKIAVIGLDDWNLDYCIPLPKNEHGTYEGIEIGPLGEIYLAEQNRGKASAKAGLIKIGMDGSSGEPYRIETQIEDQSGLHYSFQNDQIFVISDENDTMYILNVNGEVLAEYRLPGQHQEGIVIDSDGIIYIAQDSGGIIVASLPDE